MNTFNDRYPGVIEFIVSALLLAGLVTAYFKFCTPISQHWGKIYTNAESINNASQKFVIGK